MKKIALIIAIIALVISITSLVLVNKGQEEGELKGEMVIGVDTFIGTTSNYKSLPVSFVEANSTTTDTSLPDGGDTVRQLYYIEGVDEIGLSVSALGGTATSSVIVKPMYSYNGTDYFTQDTTATTTRVVGTTTLAFYPLTLSFDPGTVSTTKNFYFYPPVTRFMRLLIMGENLPTDPNDGVQAFIQVLLKSTL